MKTWKVEFYSLQPELTKGLICDVVNDVDTVSLGNTEFQPGLFLLN
jgi:hypothetical protein